MRTVLFTRTLPGGAATRRATPRRAALGDDFFADAPADAPPRSDVYVHRLLSFSLDRRHSMYHIAMLPAAHLGSGYFFFCNSGNARWRWNVTNSCAASLLHYQDFSRTWFWRLPRVAIYDNTDISCQRRGRTRRRAAAWP